MGAGDLNMKKSWHPLLRANQERVWQQEQEAQEERKKLDELRKEREHERQMQELQRIHEEAGGKKRVERVEWMYATPAANSGPSESELEDYLLGRKRVDKLLQGTEREVLHAGAQPGVHDGLDSNSQRDIAAKIREDPLFAIKRQEQAVYASLMQNPGRLREMRARLGMREETPRRYESSSRHQDERHRAHRPRRDEHREERRSRHDRSHHDERHARADRHRHDRHKHSERDRHASRHRSRSRSPRRDRAPQDETTRAAKLAAMMQDAKTMDKERNARVEKVQAEEAKERLHEDDQREATHDPRKWKQGGGTGHAAFLLDQQRNLWGEQSGGMDLHERLRRSRHGLQRVEAE
ncbi:RNA-splicing factor [Malassezia vespertilionis]|uniref:Cwc25p n=1 Tax=Malassezia vespertilionis TaxID=2020962 RepID=A0A2N1JHB4_9BASI|nr:RNA-splicing factor [Malassezia vespertilionis]PKI85927.1 Cwc25p [Malassezia vespertilionis]WFD05045.1 RNA-splicing factor [Malassezia vespertilionis]